MKYFQGQAVEIEKSENGKHYCRVGVFRMPMWIPEESLTDEPGEFTRNWNYRSPHMLIVDRFYTNPDWVRDFALQQDFQSDLRIYKGKRTKERFLWPNLKEEFERLLQRNIHDWLDQPANGVFQITGYDDPLVWHSDAQNYAAAIYLTPDAPVGAGTSFWRDKQFHCRRPPSHPLEADKFIDEQNPANSESKRQIAYDEIYSLYNLTHPDNWELVDRVGAVYNRLVIWDAKLIHSASSYQGLVSDSLENGRLVQLFFFSVE